MFDTKKFINPSLSPNLEVLDVMIALRLLFAPFALRSGDSIHKVELWFKNNFSTKYAYTFLSGRECEYALFRALGIVEGDEVLVQAFTCVAAVNPILWVGAKAVYVDIKRETLSMNVSDLEKKITPKTKMIIVQHTFGIPGDIEKIAEIAKKNNIFLLEDCAHVIGALYKGKKLGEWGDAAFFSFGRDKAVSSVFGGIVITNKEEIANRIKKIQEQSSSPSLLWICQQLLHPLITYWVIFCFNINPTLGKVALLLFKNIHVLSPSISYDEKNSVTRKNTIRKFPNALAKLCVSQLQRLGRFNKNRREIFRFYKNELKKLNLDLPSTETDYLRIPLMVGSREKLFWFCKKYSVYLGDWYSNVIDPKGTNFEHIGYQKGTCKVAEDVAGKIVNLPCHPSMDQNDAKKVVALLKLYYEKEK